MPLNYQVKKKTFGFDKDKTERYVATAQRGHTVSYDDILEEAEKQSHISRGQLYTAIDAIINVSITFMKQGHGVNMGELGIFKPSFTASSCENADEAGAQSIVRKKILYQPGKKLREFIEALELSATDSQADDAATGEPEPGGGAGEDGGGEFG